MSNIKIIAFAGRKQSGKTTCCEFVKNIFETSNHSGDCRVYNFADPLKQMCIDVFGLDYHQCYGTDDNKNELVNCKWPDNNKNMTAREVLQYVGTDVFRKMQHNVWADATVRLIEKENPTLALIADCRFPNEVEAIKNAGGIVIKLNRDTYNSTHASEVSLDKERYDESNFDLVVDNQYINLSQKNKIIFDFLITKEVLSL